MGKKRESPLESAPGKTEAEELDAINLRSRRKWDVRRQIELTIESEAKKRRAGEAAASSKIGSLKNK